MAVTKRIELGLNAKGEGCLGRSQDDEPIFILCARDRTSSKTVRQWAKNARDAGCTNDEKINDALNWALEAEQWRAAHGGGKVPD